MRRYFLTSNRLEFRTWTWDDLPIALGLWADPEVTRFHGGPWTADQVRERLALEISCLERRHVQYWPIFLRETGEHVGCCGLHPHDDAHGVWELGCNLRRSFWSQHLGREAAQAVIGHAFNVLDAQAIRAGHHPSNEASRRFLQHLGFRYTHDEFYPATQLMEPFYLLTP